MRAVETKESTECDRGPYPIKCSSFPGLKRTALPGEMLTSAPVRGFLPTPVFRGFTVKTPNPRNSIRTVHTRAFFMPSQIAYTEDSEFVRAKPVRSTMTLTI